MGSDQAPSGVGRGGSGSLRKKRLHLPLLQRTEVAGHSQSHFMVCTSGMYC